MRNERSDIFQFSELIDGSERHYRITPCAEGFRIEEDGELKGRLLTAAPRQRVLEGSLGPVPAERVMGWIRARYDLN